MVKKTEGGNTQERDAKISESMNFEEAFARLETILEKMNAGNVSLDESIKLYEEADHLINNCTAQLNKAEKKIEILVKNRNGELVTDEEGHPQTTSFP